MKQGLLVAAFLTFSQLTGFGQQSILVSPEWLQQHLRDPDLIILYTGFVIRSDFEREHIEGSRFLWPSWLAADTPEGTMNAPDEKTATRVLQDLGVNKNSRVVICHKGTDVTIAARMFLTLEHFGMTGQVYFLNGGIEAWKKLGFPVTNIPTQIKKGNFVAHTQSKLVNKNDVMRALETKSAEVVDARVKRFYDGDPTGNPRDGHIKGALNLPYPDMLDQQGRFKITDSLAYNFNAVIPKKDKEVLLYCFIGQTACVDYLAGRILGYQIKVYDGSLQEWSRDANLPMEKNK